MISEEECRDITSGVLSALQSMLLGFIGGVVGAVVVLAPADAHATELSPATTRHDAPGATKPPQVDPELVKRIADAAKAGKKPCPCQQQGGVTK